MSVLSIAASGCAGTTTATVSTTLTCIDQQEDQCPKPTDVVDWAGWLKFAGCLGVSSLSCVDSASAKEHAGGQTGDCEEDDVRACIEAGSCTDTPSCKALANQCVWEVCN